MPSGIEYSKKAEHSFMNMEPTIRTNSFPQLPYDSKGFQISTKLYCKINIYKWQNV